jgi:LAO/AO transport system ATPase/phenylacetic acid degradation protein PaaD
LLLDELARYAGRAHIVGITGVPGAGKSTLINALLREYTARGRRVGVVAIDPSSPISGGAVLGDRIRMGEGASADSVFVRSIASRGHGGGVARATRDVVDVLDAAGFETILVETVGAGQSEVEIATVADTNVVVCPPGLGDDVQAIKAGILEIAAVLVVSKCDLPHADRTVHELEQMLRLRNARSDVDVPVLRVVATIADGVPALVDAIAAHASHAGVGRRLHRAHRRPAALDAAVGTATVDKLAARDAFLRHNGIECVEVAGGAAVLRMRVAASHLNFNGTCHGGAIFALADSAFGLASNSHGTVCAGIDAHIAYHVAAREGDVLIARATEVSRSTKLGVYRVEVMRDDGVIVASFTGTVFVTARRAATS